MPRPTGGSGSTIVCAAVGDETLTAIDHRAASLQMSRSELLRRIIDESLFSDADGFKQGFVRGYAAGLEYLVGVLQPQFHLMLQTALNAAVQSINEDARRVQFPSEIMAQPPSGL